MKSLRAIAFAAGFAALFTISQASYAGLANGPGPPTNGPPGRRPVIDACTACAAEFAGCVSTVGVAFVVCVAEGVAVSDCLIASDDGLALCKTEVTECFEAETPSLPRYVVGVARHEASGHEADLPVDLDLEPVSLVLQYLERRAIRQQRDTLTTWRSPEIKPRSCGYGSYRHDTTSSSCGLISCSIIYSFTYND